MATHIKTTFDLVEDKIAFEISSELNLAGAVASIYLKSPFGVELAPATDFPANPNLIFNTDPELVINAIPKYSGTTDPIIGNYELDWAVRVPAVPITAPVSAIITSTLFAVSGLFTVSPGSQVVITGRGAGTYTVVSSVTGPSSTTITVNGPIPLDAGILGQASLFVRQDFEGSQLINFQLPQSPVNLKADVSCARGSITVEDVTALSASEVLTTRLFEIFPPQGAIDPETGLAMTPIETGLQKFVVSRITDKRWVVVLSRFILKTIGSGAFISFRASVSRNLDISCSTDLCSIKSCLDQIEAQIESLACVNAAKAVELQKIANTVHRLISIINLSQSCGLELNIDTIYEKICAQLKLSGCACGCSENQSDEPRFITPVTGISSAPTVFETLSQLLTIDDSIENGVRRVEFDFDSAALIALIPALTRGNKIFFVEDEDPFPVAIDGDIAIIGDADLSLFQFDGDDWIEIGSLAAQDGVDGTLVFFDQGEASEILDNLFGADGDLFVIKEPNEDTVFYSKIAGTWTEIFRIPRPRQVLSGSAAPDPSAGLVGDFYFQTNQSVFNPWYEKTSTGWVVRGTLQSQSQESFSIFNVSNLVPGEFVVSNNQQNRAVFINTAQATNKLSRISYSQTVAVVEGQVLSTINGDNGSGGVVVSGNLGGSMSGISLTYVSAIEPAPVAAFQVASIVYDPELNQTTILVTGLIDAPIQSYSGVLISTISGAPSFSVINNTAHTLKIKHDTSFPTAGAALKIKFPGGSIDDEIDFPPLCTAVFRHVPSQVTAQPFWLLESLSSFVFSS